MDINMKEVKLVKPDGQSWFYISEDGTNPTTKLLYDDGKTAEEIYKKTFTDFSVKGRYEFLEDWMGMVN